MSRLRRTTAPLLALAALALGAGRCEAAFITELTFTVLRPGDPPFTYSWSSADSQVVALSHAGTDGSVDSAVFIFTGPRPTS
jgi:hypothetical protein